MIVMPETDDHGAVLWNRAMESMRAMESSHVMSLLVYLKEMGPSTKMDIYRCVARGANMSEKLVTLESMGIVRMEKSGKTIVSLTEAGEEVAEHLRSVMHLIVGSED